MDQEWAGSCTVIERPSSCWLELVGIELPNGARCEGSRTIGFEPPFSIRGCRRTSARGRFADLIAGTDRPSGSEGHENVCIRCSAVHLLPQLFFCFTFPFCLYMTVYLTFIFLYRQNNVWITPLPLYTLLHVTIMPYAAIIHFVGCLTVHLPHEIIWNANLMQQGNFVNVFLSRHVSGTYTHHQEHQTSCSVWFSAPSSWMGAGLEMHRTHDLHSGSQDHHPSKNSVQKTICCNSTSDASDDGRMYPKHVELRIH